MKNYFGALVLVVIILLLGSCANMNSLASDPGTKGYAENYNKMVGIVEQAISGSTLGIVRSFEGEDEVTIVVNKQERMGRENMQSHHGEVKIKKVTTDSSIVKVINPEYHFTVPRYEQEDYQGVIFTRIDKLRAK